MSVTPELEVRDRWILRNYWPASVAKSMSYRFSKGSYLNKLMVINRGRNLIGLPASTGTHTYPYEHIYTSHAHKSKTIKES